MKTAALVLAAGRGERLGRRAPKGFVALRGRTLIERSIATLLEVPDIDCILPIVPAAMSSDARISAAFADRRVLPPIPGGAERQDSVALGLEALPDDVATVAVHDAARCLVAARDVTRVITTGRAHRAALLAVPASDTIKRVRAGQVVETPARSECWAAQTPQVFHAPLLREAIAKARADGFVGTDDAQLVERLGVAVHVVEGSPRNIKITRPEDWVLAERLLDEGAGPAERAEQDGGGPA